MARLDADVLSSSAPASPASIMAERLAVARGQRVLVIDRRDHIAGNAYDYYDEHGVLVHQYGPHIFHTNSEKVVDYLSRFTDWRPYEHRVLARVDGQLVPIPINRTTINKLYGLEPATDERGGARSCAERAEPIDYIRNSEDVVVAKVGRELYEKFFRGYTRKQWQRDPSELHASVCARIPIRTNEDDRYFTDTFQNMPADGYTAMFERMLDQPGIEVPVNTDYYDVARRDRVRPPRLDRADRPLLRQPLRRAAVPLARVRAAQRADAGRRAAVRRRPDERAERGRAVHAHGRSSGT